MIQWTPSLVEERLAEAAFVLKRLPEPRRQGYFSTWPEVVHSFGDKVGQEPRPMRILPSPQAIRARAAACGSVAPRRAMTATIDRSITMRVWDTAARISALWLASMNSVSRAAVTMRYGPVSISIPMAKLSTKSAAVWGAVAMSSALARSRSEIQSLTPISSWARVRK